MTEQHRGKAPPPTRRDFLATAAAGSALAAGLSWTPAVHAAGSDAIRVGVIGCGVRGTQAAENVLSAAPGVRVVALGDVFEDRLKAAADRLREFAVRDETVMRLGNAVDLPADRCHLGLESFKQVLADDVNYVILATPPGFRPIHLEAAVAAGKNVFTEKPAAVDGPGVRKVFAAYSASLKKGLGIAAGTQRRHQRSYIETLKRIQDGAIGELLGGRCYWNQNFVWRERRPGKRDSTQYQVNNWYGFTWLSGDPIVEQHVHNLDVMNWALGTPPKKALGTGFRVPHEEVPGSAYSFFAVDFEYVKDVHVLSMCRQLGNCTNDVSEHLVGSRGLCHVSNHVINGKPLYSLDELVTHPDPYVQEHTDLIAGIRTGRPINDLKSLAESTLTGIMGRMSAYTGREVTWERALSSEENLYPRDLNWDGDLLTPEVAIPGKKVLF
jgi:predicted dehydrogenase